MRHRIQKQLFDLKVDGRLDPFYVQQQVSDHFWTDLLPELEEQFDAAAGGDDIIMIHRLEIDLGALTPELIDSGAWAVLLREALQKKLAEVMSEVRVRHAGRVVPAAEAAFVQWLAYMRNGCLPWNAPLPSDAWRLLVLEAVAGNYALAADLRTLIIREKTAVERIAAQHEETFLYHLVEALTSEPQSALPALLALMVEWLEATSITYKAKEKTENKVYIKNLWKAVLSRSAQPERGLTTGALGAYSLTGWLKITPQELAARASFTANETRYEPLQKIIESISIEIKTSDDAKTYEQGEEPSLQEEISPVLIRVQEDSQQSIQETNEPQLFINRKETRNKESASEIEASFNNEDAIEDSASSVIPEEGVYCLHAGLILLHPFLHTFFRNLGLVSSGGFIDAEAKARAICLLHQLADTGAPAHEYNLVLPKLLCACPLQQPVNAIADYTDAEREEMTELLSTVIAQWPILKNTSPEALQQSFLQRPGKLVYQDGYWLLHVEKSPLDILLTHLPWTIGMIKLPWMKELLRVAWT